MFAYRFGLAQAPAWVAVLEMAAEWGVTPWAITGDGEEALWFLRWKARRDAKIAAEREAQNDRKA